MSKESFHPLIRNIGGDSCVWTSECRDLVTPILRIGHGPVLLNVLRLYGGGGPQVFFPTGGANKKRANWGGGGHFGFEFFMLESTSFYLEVGGQGGARDHALSHTARPQA
jgi:hypothetical protein